MSKWEMVRLGDVLSYEQPTKYIVKSTNYSDGHGTPVLTAGQSFILGYTDETSDIFIEKLPVIIFDDFTTAIKYVDFPFKVKSSAMKILLAYTKRADIKYLFYAMRTIKFDNQLHKRYWISEYSNIKIPLPPLETQKHIAKTLDTASEVIVLHKKQLAELDNLIKSIFYDMFGDPVVNDMGWGIQKLSVIAKKITDGTHQSPKFVSEGVPFLFISNIVDNKITYDTNKFISQQTYEELIKRTPVELGDILLTIVGSYGNPAIVTELRPFCFQRHIAYIKPDFNKVSPQYLHCAFLSDYVRNQIENRVKGIAQKTLNLSELKEIKIPVPPLLLQQKFSKITTKIEEQKDIVKKAIEESQYLFNSLMSEYFE